MHNVFFDLLSTDGYLGCFYVLATVNNAAVNIGRQISFPCAGFIFFDYIPRREILGFHSSIFHFFRNLHIVFYNGYTFLLISLRSLCPHYSQLTVMLGLKFLPIYMSGSSESLFQSQSIPGSSLGKQSRK